MKERDHLKELGVNGRVTLKCISEQDDLMSWAVFLWLMVGTRRISLYPVMKLRVA
jgi:hypothetical protein